jgi:hypothetical protein
VEENYLRILSSGNKEAQAQAEHELIVDANSKNTDEDVVVVVQANYLTGINYIKVEAEDQTFFKNIICKLKLLEVLLKVGKMRMILLIRNSSHLSICWGFYNTNMGHSIYS